MQREAGFTYIGVLILIAITSAAVAMLGPMWSQQLQRERERELQFRGKAIARAIASYVAASPAAAQVYPRSFEDLLEDRRGPVIRRHLRMVYVDPFTGKADWTLIPFEGQPGRFRGVRSSAPHALLGEIAGKEMTLLASDWRFDALAGAQMTER